MACVLLPAIGFRSVCVTMKETQQGSKLASVVIVQILRKHVPCALVL